MGFDIQNFGIGVLAGWASAYGVYRYRHIVSGVVDAARNRADTARNAATRSADSRLIGDLVRRCENSHLAGTFVRLSDILIEPRFLAAPQLVAPPDEDELEDVFHVVPRVYDLPYLHAPFNVPSLTISDLSQGSSALAILGAPGSGRTTALHTIALFSLNRVRFQTQTDTVNALIEAEEAKLPEKERAQRIHERLKMEAQAREKLAEERGITFETHDENAKQTVPLFNRLMPLYVSFEFFDFVEVGQGSLDPAELLVRAVQASVNRITAMTMPRNVYERLEEGQVLLLLDGLDELPPPQQEQALAWLTAFMAQYDKNFIIVTGPVRGYGSLTRLGLSPVFMRPWQDYDVKEAIRRWSAALPRFKDKKISGARKVMEGAAELAAADCRALTPLDLTAKIWATLAASDDEDVPAMPDWYHRTFERLIADKQRTPDLQTTLTKMALLQLEEGVVRRSRMVALGIAKVAGDTQTTDALRDAVQPSGKRAAKAAEDTVKKLSNPQAKLLAALVRSGLMVRAGEDAYRFRHSHIAAYFASLEAASMGTQVLAANSDQPIWRSLITFAAMYSSIDKLVMSRLQSERDVLATGLVDAVQWLRYAPNEVGWRGSILKQLADFMVMPNQYPLVRERAAAALVCSGDKSVLFILRRAARNQNPIIRRLACLAMGAIGESAAIADLRSLIQDSDSAVQLAAAMSLGAIATPEALEAMVIAFTEDKEPVRKAIAEAFAALPEDGHPILYDANRDEDMLLRRVSIAGIRRIRAGWALAAVFRTFLLDTEWYVKSAAEAAFTEIESEAANKPVTYPPPEAVEWLNAWLMKRGESISDGEGGALLSVALKDEDPQVRGLAAETMGQLGMVDYLAPLYDGLLDPTEDVRAATHRALGGLQLQIGKPLPLPAR